MKNKNIIIVFAMLIISIFSITSVKAAGFNVSRKITGVTNPVSNTFTYTVTADPSNVAVVTPLPSSETITMSGSVSSNTVTTIKSPLYAESVWTNLNYSQPGTYKFIVRETGSTNSTVYPLDSNTYTITVHVANELDSGVPTGNLIASYIGSQKNGTGTKIDSSSNAEFTSAAVLSKLTISNTLKGSGANTGEYFKYLVTINGTSGDKYTITGQDTTITYDGNTVTTSNTYTVGGTNYVYLRHGQTVTIGESGSLYQLPVGVTYTVVQQDSTDYNTYVDGSSTQSKTTGNKTISTNTNTASFINEKETVAPTGIFIKLIPFIILLVMSTIGVYMIFKNRTKEVRNK